MSKVVLVLGALSGIGENVARQHAQRGDTLLLVARRPDNLETVKADLLARGAAGCETLAIDLTLEADPAARIGELESKAGAAIDVAYLFYGILGDQPAAERDPVAARQILDVNFVSAAGWCMALASAFEQRDAGVLVVVSSVAGDRGRQSNYLYGAAKGGLTILVEGLAHRLARGKARAVAVRLGFVDTPMTAHIARKGPLWAKPDAIAQKLVGIADRPRGVRPYLPWFWRPIMTIIRLVPAPIFHKTKL